MNEVEKAVQKQVSGHERMRLVLSKLNEKQKTEHEVLGSWTVKDIIAHLIFWDEMVLDEIKQIRRGIAPETIGLIDKEVDRFNDEAVVKSKNVPLNEILSLWEQTFQKLICCLKNLSEKEFRKVVVRKSDQARISIKQIFDYTYEGLQHTAAAAKQIKDYFSSRKQL